jgi:hypothetical protein
MVLTPEVGKDTQYLFLRCIRFDAVGAVAYESNIAFEVSEVWVFAV